MNSSTHFYAAIDLKSFYASVECQERSLDPLTTNLVVADETRTDKTICLAISPSLKAYGLPGRARLFEVNQKVKEINNERLKSAPLGVFLGESTDAEELTRNPSLALDFIIAMPRMQFYLDYSSKIYDIYLHHVAPEDIFAYSIDEIFCEITSYLKNKSQTPAEFVTDMITDVYQKTGITATAGIGTNLYLAKIAMDVLAKHTKPNSAGVRIAELNETSYREQLWPHTPITDFWRIGRGYAKRLASYNLHTMGDVARCSLTNQELLYKLFGINAELLIDHAWGYEPVEISDIKQHQPEHHSLSSGQVLSYPYPYDKALVIVKEMAESLSLDLVRKHFLTDCIVLHIDYDRESQNTSSPLVTDHYGRRVPKPAHGTLRLSQKTASTKLLVDGFVKLYQENVNPSFLIRKVTVAADQLSCSENSNQSSPPSTFQADLFTDYDLLTARQQAEQLFLEREQCIQHAILKIRNRYGKNAILRGTNFESGATGRNRHHQIGGHRA